MEKIEYAPIGVIHSEFKEPKGTPIQSSVSGNARGTVEVFQKYAEGLEDIEGFSHIFLIYHFHLSKKVSLKVKPYLDDLRHGVFATRAPGRPNPVGVSVVRLLRVEGNILHIRGADIVEGTPLLDIKPYVPEFDIHEAPETGWIEENVHKLSKSRDDGRFIK
ncbi:tRNA-Thr(GGU) m(6)t(6)A37 methyltransferase TsaA [Candidatus Altiarchaeales archaeon WOR_SM1_SCG]|nr:tRNA-Thr(GGU) m(6)t(6)A37 methyltransferase TsaA [Candidatus Altiarchaeales archaeon WOR_SM1_SCG]